MTFFTVNLSAGEYVTIAQPDHVFYISVKANGGVTSLQGSIQQFKGLPTTPVYLEDGQACNVQTPSNQPADGLTITAITGTTDILIGV